MDKRNERPIDRLLPLERFARGAGFHGFGLRDPGLQPLLDPFLSVDHFYMSQPTFPPHPHAGFSAVTYLFDDSHTGFVNRDSLGHHLHIAPGALHWTQAGAGLMHEEFPIDRGLVAHGLQIFVNLPAGLKQGPPSVFHLESEEMPLLRQGEVGLRVVFGRFDGHRSPLGPGSEAALTDAAVPAGAELSVPLPAGHTAFVLVVEGALQGVGQDREALSLTPSTGAAFLPTGEASRAILRNAGEWPARCALFSGIPLREPVVFGGPFVMNTPEQIEQARRAFVAGAMGQLLPIP